MKNRLRKNILIFCAALGVFSFTAVQAQQDEISTTTTTAQVLDESGMPVPSVFVISFVANDKVLTDAEGNFSIKVASRSRDQIVIDEPGYEINITETIGGTIAEKSLTLKKVNLFDKREISLPYQPFNNNRNVSSVNIITGEELASHPSTSFLEALAGRLPGLDVRTMNTAPGHESVYASIRGVSASIYIDGIMRDPSDLSVFEVETVQVIKDLSGRAMLGISGVNPVIWITTKKGVNFNKEVKVSAEYGFSSPTSLPGYLDSYQYASLYNEALQNDGQLPLYTQEELDAYRDGTNPLFYPNIDYYGRYVKTSTPLRRVNVNFSGGDERVNYFSLLDYVGSDGLESIGEQTKSDRFKLRGNANIKLTDFIQMNVNLSGTYGKSRYPNEGGSAGHFNMFDVLSSYPSNAHAMNYKDSLLLISDDYGTNMENELLHSGYAIGVDLNTQNSASLLIDLNDVLEGLTFSGTASFDIYSNITTNKGGTSALYRLLADTTFQRIQEEVIEPTLSQGFDDFLRRTVGYLQFNYDRVFNKHAITMNATYYQGLVESRSTSPNYQPAKMQDLSYRANYVYDEKYILQLDLSYSGSMKLPVGKQFNLYPTVGAAWVASKESFLSNVSAIDYLKVYTSLGVMGNDNFSLSGYNPYYLSRTLWYDAGDWQSGIQGSKGSVVNVYNIQQAGSSNFTLPKRSYMNIGAQADLYKKLLSVELNYFYQKDYDHISQKSSSTPSLYGTEGFLPATNFGANNKWGLDGMVSHSNKVGDFQYSLGVNMMYIRGKELIVDEPVAQEEYRKRANKDSDLIWMYEADGLYQSQTEIDNSTVTQSWGTVKPGDIRYVDYNIDGTIDEKDIHTTEAHFPRISYGINLSANYKGIGVFILGQGIADGETILSDPKYFWVNGSNQNYSEVMLDRWPNTNDYPRLTTQSQNNYQTSSFWLANAAYFRLKNVEVSYTLPRTLTQKVGARDVKLFARGTNLLVMSELSKYNINPENSYAGVWTYPMLKSYTFGVSCKF